jgi:hypothetical protein
MEIYPRTQNSSWLNIPEEGGYLLKTCGVKMRIVLNRLKCAAVTDDFH